MDFLESYDILPPNGSNCPSIPDIRATLLSKYGSDANWYLLQPSDILSELTVNGCWGFEYELHEHPWAPGIQDPADYQTYWHGHTPH